MLNHRSIRSLLRHFWQQAMPRPRIPATRSACFEPVESRRLMAADLTSAWPVDAVTQDLTDQLNAGPGLSGGTISIDSTSAHTLAGDDGGNLMSSTPPAGGEDGAAGDSGDAVTVRLPALNGAPRVLDQWFEYDAMQAICIRFDQDVSAFVGSLSVTAWNAGTGGLLVAELADYDASTHVATFSFADDGTVIADGNYTAQLTRKPGTEAELQIPPAFEFFFKQGDATRDRTTDLMDFQALRANFGRSDGALFSEGDFNYDGRVDLIDFGILRTEFGQSLAQAPRPLVITSGGTYSGAWQSLDAQTPAVLVMTSEPVVIENATIRGRGELIRTGVSGVDLTVRNVEGYGLNPQVHGQAPGRFLYAFDFASVVVRDSHMQNTGGIKLVEYSGDRTAGQTVSIVGNSALNIDGRKSDGNGGWLDFNKRTRLSDGHEERGYEIRQFLQLDKVRDLPGVRIAWNQVINEPGNSRVEDNINIYKSSGTPQSPILIHDNYIQGAYTIRPAQGSYSDDTYSYSWKYSGGGILLGDGDGTAGWVRAYDNQVVSTTNYGIAVYTGHDTEFHDNRVLSSGLLDDGRAIWGQNVGIYIWDGKEQGDSSFYNNSARDNLVGWMKGQDRNDWWAPDATTFTGNTSWQGELTLETEEAEYQRWQNKRDSARTGTRSGD